MLVVNSNEESNDLSTRVSFFFDKGSIDFMIMNYK